MNKVVDAGVALSAVENGMTVMIGGNMGQGTPDFLISGLLELDVRDLTIITSDISDPDSAAAKLIGQEKVKKVITTHMGNFASFNRLAKSGRVEFIIIPRGTLTKYIQAGRTNAAGHLACGEAHLADLQQKRIIRIDGRQCILQVPFNADVALVKAYQSDHGGNLRYRREARNFNPIMALAARVVIAETESVVGEGEMDKDEVLTPGNRVNFVVVKSSYCFAI